MKIKRFITLIAISLGLYTNSCFAVNQISKELYIKQGHLYLLGFDEKVIHYKIGDESSIKVELLSNIYKNRHELIIKPIKELNTNLLIWTKSNVYNFNVNTLKRNSPNSKKINNSYSQLQEFKAKNIVDGVEIDSPPSLPQHSIDDYDFEIDTPPSSSG